MAFHLSPRRACHSPLHPVDLRMMSRILLYTAMVEKIVSSFKRLLGEALRVVKPEYIMIEIVTKIDVYDKTWDVMRKATGRNRECETRAVGEDRTPPCADRDPYGGQSVQIMLGHKL